MPAMAQKWVIKCKWFFYNQTVAAPPIVFAASIAISFENR
jgi:hypothetical protein